MAETFEYDVFISFASADQEIARLLWEELGHSGLRVFWSDAALRDRAGSSWFEATQDALDRSRHLVVLFTPDALQSTWVKREYVAFFNHCYHSPERRLVPVLAAGVTSADLPLFLRELEACALDDSLGSRLAPLLGGNDVRENATPEPAKREPWQSQAVSGLRLLRIGAVLNAILCLGVAIVEARDNIFISDVRSTVQTFLFYFLFFAWIPCACWMYAGVLIPHRHPFMSAVIPALLIFSAGAYLVGGSTATLLGLIFNGVGPLAGSVYLILRSEMKLS